MSFKKILAVMLAAVTACSISASALTLDVAESADEAVAAKDAVLAAETSDVWDGTVDTSWYNASKTEFTITTAEQFAGLAYLVNGAQSYNPALDNDATADFGYYAGEPNGNKSARPDESATANSISFEGKTIKLAVDLDLCPVDAAGNLVKLPGNEQLSMMPVGYSKYTPFKGTFDGQGHTIKNLFQGGWDLYGLNYKNVYLGLFGCVEDATIKNFVVDNFAWNCEINLGAVAGIASGTTTFDNITVQNSVVSGGGGWWTGGLVGWGYGNLTFNKIIIDETTTVAQTGGHYDTAVGGIVGGSNNVAGESFTFTDCYIACKLDVFNDCVANYDTNSYRNCGMIIGGIGEDNELMIDGKKYPNFSAKGITCENVKVVIGEWANYTYVYSYELPKNCQRLEPGVGYKGVDLTKLGDYSLNTSRTFNAIFGAENAGDLSNVRGAVDEDVMEFLGVTGIAVENKAQAARYEVKIVKNSATLLVRDVYYATIEEALAAAVDGDTIVLLKDIGLESANIKEDITIDLNGKTLTVDAEGIMDSSSGATAAIQAWGNVVITNGNIAVSSEEKINNGIFYVAAKDTASLTLNNVTLTATDTNGTTVFVSCKPGNLEIVDSTVTAKNVGKLIEGSEVESNATIENSQINISDSERALVNIKLTATDSEIVISNLSDNAFRNVSGTVTDTTIDANGYENGIKNDTGLSLEIKGDSDLVFTGADEANGGKDLVIADGSTFTAEESATVVLDTAKVPENVVITDNITVKASKIYVQYKKVDLDTNGVDNLEGADKYEIVLVGYDATVINELASADLTFKFVGTPVTGGNMAYTVEAAKGVTLTQLGNRYMFNYNGADKYEETGKAIVIGTLTVSGYGSYTLATDDTVTTNAVYATEIRDNIVEGFDAAGKLIINENNVVDGMYGEITDGNIAVPTRTLTVNVAFPNSVNDNEVAVQAMKVEITGNIDGVQKTVTYDLGGNMTADGTYVVTEDRLVLNDTYNVVVSGAGYRTARYTVTMTDAKTLNFWNNVKDNKVEVEDGKSASATSKNFLAGDIVGDNNINIYDLSAVVSYFATTNDTSAYSDYAKYDLNRDGKIDSKDVAYVLVSWGE